MSPQRSVHDLTLTTSRSAVDDLRRRLEATRWPDDVADQGWAAGMPISAQRELVDRWVDFDWSARETELNRDDHHLVTVGDRQIHAVRHRGTGPAPLPLVITHGWPSTFHEWHRVIGPLTDPGAHGGDPADAFDVVTPSLPGYGYSPAPSIPGTTPRDIAALWVEVMAAFGYDRFGAQGCDWGSFVTSFLGLDHPDRLIGVHMGMVSLGAPRDPGASPSAEEKEYAARFRAWRAVEHGYVAIQSSKPQTLATALTDSPAGMAAWIAEKWSTWSDRHEDGSSMVPWDDILTTLSIYWHTRTIGSANRLYYESAAKPQGLAAGQRVEVPSGFLLETGSHQRATERQRGTAATDRAGAPPRSRVEQAFNVAQWTEAPTGGHFPALETPDLYVDEVRTFFRPLR
ncbi:MULTISPECIES: epoxide hydrolase family protein [Nocardiaceae]|uniref:Pimeloyl-ACP methyl ester carboxylesterase n=1 Tax=Rhodococcoides corynebacterioides TaxID=53972 RepID=A0ABS2KMR1_9NOCA|nr:MULTISPECIES: epoxide hydrolase family protein [Rhodococcus]MBM7413280.1 pimeloyl-ACP methyl ester carboxylesterase [Rhodococcus corynebacterioides]MBP1115743.1 pimeloyl-ACP methyl ester carboxylesterase [Rhodococcus sp. PvP016]